MLMTLLHGLSARLRPRGRAGIAILAATVAIAIAGTVAIILGAVGGAAPVAHAQPLPTDPFSINPAAARQLPPPAALATPQPGSIASSCRPEQISPSVQIGAQCIFAPIVNVGTDPSGSLTLPSDVHLVGYDMQTAPLDAALGTTVIAGHVDNRDQGPGAFFYLYRTVAGTEITVTAANGHVSRWRAYRVVSVNKARLPADIFSTSGPRRLVLVTCGGALEYVPGYGYSYSDNVLVYATPA